MIRVAEPRDKDRTCSSIKKKQIRNKVLKTLNFYLIRIPDLTTIKFLLKEFIKLIYKSFSDFLIKKQEVI